jgi:hypothetical protein
MNTNYRFVVVFRPSSDAFLSFALKKGFGHCLVLIEGVNGWTAINPLKDRIIRKRFPAQPLWSIEQSFAESGFVTVAGLLETTKTRGFEIQTCVTVVKRTIGINNPFLVTPFQLFRYLQRIEPSHPLNE